MPRGVPWGQFAKPVYPFSVFIARAAADARGGSGRPRAR